MRGSLKGRARFRQRKRRRPFFRRVAAALDVSTSSDLASLGHLPLKGKAERPRRPRLPLEEIPLLGEMSAKQTKGSAVSARRKLSAARLTDEVSFHASSIPDN